MSINVSNFQPAPGASIAVSGTLSFDVTFSPAADALAHVIMIAFGNTSTELAFDGEGFVAPYASSSRQAIAGGYRYTIRRSGHWSSPPVVTVRELASQRSPELEPVRCILTANATSGDGGFIASGLTDGVTLEDGDRVALVLQTDKTENGIYVVQDGGLKFRADGIRPGMAFVVLEGTRYAGTQWRLTSPTSGTIILGTTELVFSMAANLGAVTAAAVLGADATVADTQGDPVTYRGGKCLTADAGERNWGHFIHQHGVAASANSYQAAKIVHQYGDARIGAHQPEGEWTIKDDGPVGDPGYDTDADGRERTPYWLWSTGTNPTTGKPVRALFDIAGDYNLQTRGNIIRTLQARSTYDQLAFTPAAPSSTDAGDGQGGYITHLNRKVSTSSTTPRKIFVGNLVAPNLWAYVHCRLIYNAPAGDQEFFSFRFVWFGQAVTAGIYQVEDAPKSASDTAIAGRVSVADNGTGDGKIAITVTGKSGQTATQTLFAEFCIETP